MPDSSQIANALVAKLAADATLTTLAPDGVYFDLAPTGKSRVVLVGLVAEEDESMFGDERAYESTLFLVKAVMLSTANGNIQAAAARIDVLLDDGTLTVPGYTLMAMYREHLVRLTEIDEVDPDIRWQHRGGQYRVMVCAA